MKKSELVKLLQDIKGDPIIIMSKDGEGNRYSPLSDLESEFYYKAESSQEGFLMEEQDMDEEDYDNIDIEKCVVFYPMS